MTEKEAKQQLAAPPAPNIMGRDLMCVTERKWVYPQPPSKEPPFQVITAISWETF